MKLVAAMPFLVEPSETWLEPKRSGTWLASKMVPIHGEGLAALVALVNADAGALALHLADALDAAAMRANRAVRPTRAST